MTRVLACCKNGLPSWEVTGMQTIFSWECLSDCLSTCLPTCPNPIVSWRFGNLRKRKEKQDDNGWYTISIAHSPMFPWAFCQGCACATAQHWKTSTHNTYKCYIYVWINVYLYMNKKWSISFILPKWFPCLPTKWDLQLVHFSTTWSFM